MTATVMDFSSLTVLVVEDHDFQRQLIVQMLQGLGVLQLHESGDGRAALDLLGRQPQRIDIVICDLDMPEMDGVEFIRHIAERQLTEALVVASGLDTVILSTVETMARAYGLPVLGAIKKPVTVKRLNEVLSFYRSQAHARDLLGGPSPFDREELHAAVSAGEMRPHFQPQIDLSTGQVFGVEALVRWPRDGQPPIAAGIFIPAVEEAGLIGTLTTSVFEQSCAAQARWRAQGLHLNVAINVSLLSIDDVSLADHYLDIVQRHGGDPREVTIEITESSVLQEPARVLNVLARLRLKGFGIAIDDFGTGYSSMQQLSQLPFTELKIDQSFVRNAPEQPRRQMMVETSLELARKLGLRAIAEGCETRAEWDLLVALGCDLVQGWFIAKAMPADELPAWIAQWQPLGR